MNFSEIETAVSAIDTEQGYDLLFDLLRAYGVPKASVTLLRNGTRDLSDFENEALWKGKVFYRYVKSGEAALHSLIDASESDERITKNNPRFIIIRDDERLLAVDRKTRDTLDIALDQLGQHAAFFMPWAGVEKTAIESANLADIKAAERMARLYDEVIKQNDISTDVDIHNLNVFFSRLLFCFFAEDTEVFPEGSFTNAIASLTVESGADLAAFLDDLFEILNTAEEEREQLASHFREFGYVNGSLFDQQAPSPAFSAKARKIVLECGELDWAQINPDIFGSMIQAVVHPGDRGSLGMHYTSVENIMKVLRPLFLDELDEEFDKAKGSLRKLQNLHDRIADINVFDPACGSGNFLVIAYKELRRLEHKILQRIEEVEPNEAALFSLSRIKLDNFYGIEIDDFAHEVAILSLWLAKHQMNLEFKELFGVEIGLIPLREAGQIVTGNAARLDWHEICALDQSDETYVVGNPPYLGAKLQSADQKSDIEKCFEGSPYPKNLDYVAIWFVKGAEFISVSSKRALAFVATNSVVQGEHVGIFFPLLSKRGTVIEFAHASFKWGNLARGNAGVSCVVVGLRVPPVARRVLYSDGGRREVSHINPYLVASSRDTLVLKRAVALSDLPRMSFGSMPGDGGNLLFTSAERDALLQEWPAGAEHIRAFAGADEHLSGSPRYCLLLDEESESRARDSEMVRKRLRAVADLRAASKRSATRALAAVPWRFQELRHQEGPSIIVPLHTSERRPYVPIGLLDGNTVISNAANAIFDAEPWVFGIVQSRMHMVWMRAVSGRLGTGYRYSGTLVYNTFPVPTLSDKQKESLAAGAMEVLAAREQFPGKSLAELYDPDEMPDELRAAHTALDETVDRIYKRTEFNSDEQRLELLFDMYEKLTAGEELTLDV